LYSTVIDFPIEEVCRHRQYSLRDGLRHTLQLSLQSSHGIATRHQKNASRLYNSYMNISF